MKIYEVVGEGESQTCAKALVLSVGTILEGAVEVLQLVLGDTEPCVTDYDADAVKFVVGDYEENLAEDDTIVSDIYFPRWVIMKKEKSFTLCQYFSEMRWADDWERYIDFSSHMDEYLKNGLPLDRGRMITPNDKDWDAGE